MSIVVPWPRSSSCFLGPCYEQVRTLTQRYVKEVDNTWQIQTTKVYKTIHIVCY